jgi:hypothetical protein
MPPSSTAPKDETFTFRLDRSLKAELARAAAEDHLQPGELLRALVRRHLAHRTRRAFAAEAHRQSLLVARQGAEPRSDEAQVMRELDAYLDSGALDDAWTS